MNRKQFLQQLGLITAGTSVGLGSIPMTAFAHNPVGLTIEGTNGKILVMVQLAGGNDGLNTVIPYQNDTYYTKRPDIGIKADQVLRLNSQIGLNPGLTAFKELYDNGKMTVVQNVGYDKPNRSHFRATDIWLSGSDAAEVLDEGWAGRYLAKLYPSFPLQTPPEPAAIQLGSVESMILKTNVGSFGTVFESPDNFATLVKGSSADTDPLPDTFAGEEVKYMRQVAAQSIQYSDIIKKKADAGKNQVTYPTSNLANQLKIVANLISGGLQTPVYLTTIGGFDTHANQVQSGSTGTGYHANLLKTVADAIAAFQKDLDKQGNANKVTVMTFSEFGRRVNQNGTLGTDHGTCAPLFVVGNSVRGGVLGKNPNLNALDNNGDLIYQFDYRQIYASVLQDHLGVDNQAIKNIMVNKDFSTIPIFRANTNSPLLNDNPDFSLEQNYPNPFVNSTRIEYMLNKAMNARLAVYDMTGREIMVLRDGLHPAGNHFVNLNTSDWVPGLYLYSLKTDLGQKTLRMVRG